jgi:hypothetical protein
MSYMPPIDPSTMTEAEAEAKQTMLNTAQAHGNGGAKQPKVKPDGRIGTLEKKVDTLIWLHAELMWKLQLAAAKQMLDNPEVKERLQQALVQQMQNGGGI